MSMFQYYCSLHYPEYFDNVNIIIEYAEKYSTIFSADGTSADIKAGKLRNSAPIHALRSFIWSACEIQEGKVKSSFPSDAPEEMWIDLAAFIGLHGYANYSPVNKKTKRFGAALLRKEEVRSIYTDGCGFDNSQCLYQDETIGKTMSNASINSLFQLVDVLSRIMPIMDFYYTSLKAESDYSNGTVEAMRMVLEGWVTFAFACRQPFFIVPEKYCAEDKDMSSALSWAIAPEMDETSDGIFTLSGTEIVKAKNCAEEVIIPDGVTGMIVNEDTLDGLKRAFRNTNRIVYPQSYTGVIVIPPNVREIEVLGDLPIITTKRLSDDIPRLETLAFLGRPKAVASHAFECLNSLDKITLPEGVEKLYDEAFYSWNSHGELFLPESLNSIDDNVFNEFRIPEDVTIYVFKTCPEKSKIVKQLNDHKKYWDEQNRKYPDYSRNRKYRIKLIEQESPWSICANLFIKRLDYLYDGLDNPDASSETVKEILEETIGGYDYFIKCKEFIIKKAKETNRTGLVELILNSNDDLQLYETLPEKLAEDIKKYQDEKALNNAKKDLRDAEEVISRSEITIRECEKTIEKERIILEEKNKALADFKESQGRKFEEDKLRITSSQGSLRTVISNLGAHITELKRTLVDTQKELDHTSFFKFSRKKELVSKIEELDSESKNSNDKLSEENARLTALNAEYNNKMQMHQQALALLNKEISDCSQRINTNNSRIASLQRTIEDKRRTVIELKDKLNHLEEEQNRVTKTEKIKKAEEDLLAKIEAEIGGRFRSRIRDKFSKKSLKKKEDKKPKEPIKENDKLIREDLLGWKPLPLDDSGVLEGQETDNELRELIQLIDFSKLNN